MTLRKTVLSLAVLLLATVPLALAQGTYTQIDYPGALYTFVVGIDTAGDITGYYTDSSGISHGLILSGATYTTIDYPGATDTYFYGVNDVGQIVGFTGTVNIGFIYDTQTQAFTQITFPGNIFVSPGSINNAGIVVGSIEQPDRFTTGFEAAGAARRRIVPSGALFTVASGITASNEIVGYFESGTGANDNFSFFDGKYQLIQIPNAPNALVLATNPLGTALVGSYNPSSGTAAGFLFQGKVLTSLQFPGSSNTYASGINAAGEVVGDFYDSSGIEHGFTWTPPADAAKK
jgi:probable HAF family extracellular repeat protein